VYDGEWILFLGVDLLERKKARPRLKVESKAGWDGPCDGHGWLACTETNVRSLGVRAVPYRVTDTEGNYLVVLHPLCSLFGAFTYIFKVETLPQVCQFHVRRWVGQVLHELKQSLPLEWVWVLDEVKELLAELPLEGSRRLFELWEQIPEKQTGQAGERSPLAQLRHLLIRMSEHWVSYRVFDWQKDVPWTNNGTEQAIGRRKMRSRPVRGYKSWQGMEAALLLTGSGLAW
jgi:hypothetical protein